MGAIVQTPQDNDVARLFSEKGVLLAFIGIFVIGLALNLTPCVYPMLSVTVSLFGANEASSVWKAFGRAAVYVLGIASMYTVLGTVDAFTGSLFGGVLQSPWVLASVGALLFALAASMLGLYEIRLPAGLTTTLGAWHGAAGSFGLLLSGLVVGIFAAPCIGPPVIALLAFVGANGDPLFGSAAFLTLSLGLGLPYLILGTFSGLLNRLLRSGTVVEEASRFTMLKVDLAQFDSPEAEQLRRPYDVAGVPTLVMLDASGREVREERTVGFVRPDVMLMRMRRVANASVSKTNASDPEPDRD